MSNDASKNEISKYVDPSVAVQQAVTAADPREAVADGFETRMRVTLKDGQQLRGIFLGRGDEAEVTDPDTGEIRQIGTWLFSPVGAPGVELEILGASNLDRQLGKLDEQGQKGSELIIMRAGQERTNRGRMVTKWLVFKAKQQG